MTLRRLAAALAALMLLIAACGDDDSRELPPTDDTVAGAAGTCPEGTPDCEDTLFPGEEPDDGLRPNEVTGDLMPTEDALTVGEALAAGEGELLMVQGFYVDTGSGPMLCEALAESFPPQCGGASIPLADISAVDPESIQTEQTTSWSDHPVFILGEIVDGVFVPSPFVA